MIVVACLFASACSSGSNDAVATESLSTTTPTLVDTTAVPDPAEVCPTLASIDDPSAVVTASSVTVNGTIDSVEVELHVEARPDSDTITIDVAFDGSPNSTDEVPADLGSASPETPAVGGTAPVPGTSQALVWVVVDGGGSPVLTIGGIPHSTTSTADLGDLTVFVARAPAVAFVDPEPTDGLTVVDGAVRPCP